MCSYCKSIRICNVQSVLGKFARREVIPSAEQFFASHEAGNASRAARQVVEAIKINAAQVERDGDALAHYLLSHKWMIRLIAISTADQRAQFSLCVLAISYFKLIRDSTRTSIRKFSAHLSPRK